MDEWMSNMILTHPQKGVVPSKPARAVDACFDQHGDVIASGPKSVWDGIRTVNRPGTARSGSPSTAPHAEWPVGRSSRVYSGRALVSGQKGQAGASTGMEAG